eukprot:15329717-Ditylum_brightwellii.AAC.1
MTYEEGVAKLVVREISMRYKEKISGWWFDHAHFGDIELLAKEALRGNAGAALTFNIGPENNPDGSRVLKRARAEEHYTCGHPTPVVQRSPDWDGNESMIRTIENHGPYLDGSLAHMFIPMQEKWFAGKACFKKKKIVDWTLRVVKAGGAITWATALEDKKVIPEKQLRQLEKINRVVGRWKKREEGCEEEEDTDDEEEDTDNEEEESEGKDEL